MNRAEQLRTVSENLVQAQTALRAAQYELGPRDHNQQHPSDLTPSVAGHGDRLFASGVLLEQTAGSYAQASQADQPTVADPRVRAQVSGVRHALDLAVGDVPEADGTGLAGAARHLKTARGHLKTAGKVLADIAEAPGKADRAAIRELATQVGIERQATRDTSKAVKLLSGRVEMSRTEFRVRTQFHGQPTADGRPTPDQVCRAAKLVQGLGDVLNSAAERTSTHTGRVADRVGDLAKRADRAAEHWTAIEQTGQAPLTRIAAAPGTQTPRSSSAQHPAIRSADTENLR